MMGDFPFSDRCWHETDGTHLDVRGMQPPEPMVAILALLEMTGQEGPVVVHHFRDPIYLYPELADRGWTCTIIDGDEGEVRLLLRQTE